MGAPRRRKRESSSRQIVQVESIDEPRDEKRSTWSTRRSAITMQLELVKCGKGKCKKWHGPYWYAYRKIDGRTHSVYIGRKRDDAKARERLGKVGA